jgi:3-methyladenine DNA glycosylase/8-oxoguanine DNA glycosylase
VTIQPITTIVVLGDYSLRETCGPVAWGGGRWPNLDLIDGCLVWVGLEQGRTATRIVRQPDPAKPLLFVAGQRRPEGDHLWAERVLGIGETAPEIDDPVVADLASRFPGMRPTGSPSLYDGVIGAIVGQSITVKAAAVTERRLAALLNEPVELLGRAFWPLPSAGQMAAADPAVVRTSGVTQRRADALVAIARLAVDSALPSLDECRTDPEEATRRLMALPLVGRWTAESILLWGAASPDRYPSGDVALLRAARLAYGRPTLTMHEMDGLSEGWRPGRSWAARWLWLNLLGPAG